MNSKPPTQRLVCQNTPDVLAKLRRRLPPPYSLETTKGKLMTAQLLDSAVDSLWSSGVLLLKTERRLLAITVAQKHWLDLGDQQVAFVEDIDNADFRNLLTAVPTLRSMRPVFDISVRQTSARLLDEDNHIRVSIDTISLWGKRGSATLIDLYPAQDSNTAYRTVVKALHKLGATEPARDADAPPAQLFHQLLPHYSGRGYVANPGVSLKPKMTVEQATTAMIRTYIDIARRNEEGIVADFDTEYLHDYRVSLRRVRSIMSLFKGAYEDEQQRALNRRLSTLMRRTNRLRDLDVYLMEQADDYAALPPSMHEGLAEIFAAFSAERHDEWQRLADFLRSRAYRVEMRELQRSFAQTGRLKPGRYTVQPCRRHAADLIRRRYRKVCTIAATIDAQTPDQQVHELRLQCKKLRYLLDLSAPLFEREGVKKIIKPLKRLQDNLGCFNDYSVQQIALQQFLDQRRQDDPHTSTQMIAAVAALIAVKHRLQLRERALVMQNFAQFHVPATDALFKDLFAKAN